jgi:hypothetical protein
MKKFLLPLAAVLLMASGCTKEYVTKQYVTEQKIIQGMDMSLIDFEVKNDNWAVREVENGNDDEGYFEAVLEVPEITQEVVKKGLVLVSRRYLNGSEYIWTPLPAMRTEKTNLNDAPYYFTTYTDFEWSEGKVNIYVTASDLFAGQNPGDMYFRVAVQL